MDPSWTITEENQLDGQATDRLGNKFLIGNGYFGYRGTLEEYSKEQKAASIVAGLYDQAPGLWREPVNMPNAGYVQVTYRGEALHAQTSQVVQHSQTLDLQSALHLRSTTFRTADGNTITLRSQRFASAARPHLLCLQVTLEAGQNCDLKVRTGIDGDVWDLNGPHLCETQTTAAELLCLTAHTQEKDILIAVCEDSDYGAWDGPQACLQEEKRVLHEVGLHLMAGQAQTFYCYGTLHTAVDSPNPLQAGQELCREAVALGYARLFAEHCAVWAERWQQCDVQIDGDEAAQIALRFSLYHLLSIAPTHTDRASIPARGLSGQMYKGAIFWDTEIFMLPFFAQEFPGLARNLLMYRVHTLEGARRKAREYGYRGAYYAWESQETGDDACTLFNVSDVFTNRPIRTYFRDKQIHISADIVYAIWQYYLVTKDDSLLLDGCAEVVLECARFLLSYLYYSREKNRYELLDVTGPDEYHERVHNNAYTNWMAAHAFDVCLRLVDVLQERYPAQAKALTEALDFAPDLQALREIRTGLYQPAPDSQTRIIPQFDGYASLEDPSLEELLGRKLHPHEYLGGGSGLATATQILKQADVILALNLFPEQCSREVAAANWEYYQPRTEQGSSLSACSYAIVAARTGKIEPAYRFFMDTATIDLTGEAKQYVGTLYIGGTHPAANGGAWLAVVSGFCGIHWSGNTLHIDPHLPAHWKEVSVPLQYLGQRYRIHISHECIAIQSTGPGEGEIWINASCGAWKLSGSQKAVFLFNGVLPA